MIDNTIKHSSYNYTTEKVIIGLQAIVNWASLFRHLGDRSRIN